MNTQLVIFSEKMQNAPDGELNFYTHLCHNGFNQAILEHLINGEIKAAWMSSNTDETNYLINKFSHLLKS